MRILEQCTSAWPMPDVQQQVDALRLAFSADVNRPFELKSSFPYSSPSEGYEPSPPMPHYPAQLPREHSFESQHQLQYQTITPPISAGPRDKDSSPNVSQTLGLMPGQSSASMQGQAPEWDPSRLISQWDSAFAIPPSAMAPPGSGNSPPITTTMNIPMSSSQAIPHGQPASSQQMYAQQYPPQTGMTALATPQSMPQQPYAGPSPVFVSSKAWQQSVASVYDPNGLKRSWSKMEPRG